MLMNLLKRMVMGNNLRIAGSLTYTSLLIFGWESQLSYPELTESEKNLCTHTRARTHLFSSQIIYLPKSHMNEIPAQEIFVSLGDGHHKIWPMTSSFLKNSLILATHSTKTHCKSAAVIPLGQVPHKTRRVRGEEEAFGVHRRSNSGVRRCKQGSSKVRADPRKVACVQRCHTLICCISCAFSFLF